MFPPMLIGAAVGGAASCFSLVHHYRQQLGPMTVREARLLASLPVTSIADAAPGLVKLVGVVGAERSHISYYHRAKCAALELDHFQIVDTATGPRRLLVKSERHIDPFHIEDDSGRVAIDPARVRIDYEVEGTDLASTIEERRIRVGERVVVIGVVRRTTPMPTTPMRQAQSNIDQTIEFDGAPLLTWRSEPEVYPRLLPPMGGVALSAGSIGMAVLGTLLEHL